MKTYAYAAPSGDKPLAPFSFDRRDPRDNDVAIDILFCGVCHSDLHTARAEWGGSQFPCVPGHEIVGRVTAVGSKVSQFKVGQLVGVGCMVDSCQVCESCKEGLENYCNEGFTGTYNGADRETGGNTYGGYSSMIVVREEFVLRLPEGLDPAAAAPLLCAGITTYSPLAHWKVKQGDKVGVVGLGGLGHMGVKIAKAMGAEVTLFTTSPGKEADARRLGADRVVISRDAQQMASVAGSLDFLLNTVAAPLDLDPYLNTLKRDGVLTLVGAPAEPHKITGFGSMIFRRRTLAGSLIGGVKETQEMLDFCAQHDIVSDIEVIDIKDINTAYDRMQKGDVKYRFVIDMQSLKNEAAKAA